MLPTSYYNTACLCFLPPKVANFAYLVAYGRACHYTPFFVLFSRVNTKDKLFLFNFYVIDLSVVIGGVVCWTIKNICYFQPSASIV